MMSEISVSRTAAAGLSVISRLRPGLGQEIVQAGFPDGVVAGPQGFYNVRIGVVAHHAVAPGSKAGGGAQPQFAQAENAYSHDHLD